LYALLHDNREGKILVFDDCDSVFKDQISVNLLKAALDSYNTRVISWHASKRPEDLPSSFEFEGQVIFLSNVPVESLDDAVKSRSFVASMTFNREEMIDRFRQIYKHVKLLGMEVPNEVKLEVIDYLDEVKYEFESFNVRTLIKAIRLRIADSPDWKLMVRGFA